MSAQAPHGYVTLIAVLIVSAITVTSAIGISIIGVDSARQTTENVNSGVAKAMVDACAEEALQQIRANTAFTGTNTLTLNSQTCSYTVTNTGGTGRQIKTSATVVSNTRRATIILVIIGSNISVTSWQETVN